MKCKPPYCTCGNHILADEPGPPPIEQCYYPGCDDHHNLGERPQHSGPMQPVSQGLPIWPIGPIQGGICTGCSHNWLMPQCKCAETILQTAHEAEESDLIQWDTTRREWVDVRP